MTGTWTTFAVPDSSTGTFTADIMLLLTDGSVLVHNGFTSALANASQWRRLTPDSAGRYETGSWSPQLDMKFARQWFASGVLRDGRVFVIGGEDSTAGSDTPTGEIFDPVTNSWSDISKPASFDFVRGDCNGSVLADGRVLIGGATPSGPPSSWSKRTAIWDPHNDTWVEAGRRFGTLATTDKTDPFEEETFVLLRDGSVLAPSVRDQPKAQRYVPLLDEWLHVQDVPVSLAIDTLLGVGVFEIGPSILLPDGRVFAIGGSGQTALFTPGPHINSPGSWTAGPVFPNDTSGSPLWPTLTTLDAPACLLPSGKVVCLAGTTAPDGGGFFSRDPVFLEFDPNIPAVTLPKLDAQPTLPAGNFTWQSAFLLLPTGQLLCSAQSNHLFLYTPDPASGLPHHTWRPAHIDVAECMVPGHSYRLSGTQINGLSQAVIYGDDGGMATNYPIVRLTHHGSGRVAYSAAMISRQWVWLPGGMRPPTCSTAGSTFPHRCHTDTGISSSSPTASPPRRCGSRSPRLARTTSSSARLKRCITIVLATSKALRWRRWKAPCGASEATSRGSASLQGAPGRSAHGLR
ncbi:MAG TPA: kelch repeat-containing protein [Acetobacteraceae bacterium]|nr:kelch repeat-containing protein [Acetobacteraceae bacterium]